MAYHAYRKLSMMASPTAIVFGLDGATLEVVLPWVEAGALPNLASMMKRGAWGSLRSTLPYITPIAWPTIYTGTNPGKHGIFGFAERRPGTYEWAVMSSLDLRRPTIWELLSHHGMTCAALFCPYTYPARPFGGTIVASSVGPKRNDAQSIHPDSLAKDIQARFGHGVLWEPRQTPGMTLGVIATRMEQAVNEQTAVMEQVLKSRHHDFVFAVWHDPDRAAHLFWHHSDLPCPDVGSPLYRVYKAVDDGIGRVLETVGEPSLTVVCSDHGTYPVVHRVDARAWLQTRHLLARGRPPSELALSAARRIWLRLPRGVQQAIPLRVRRRAQQHAHEAIVQDHAITWEQTSVYPQVGSAEALFVNLAGREPRGTVSREQMSDVVARVKVAAGSLRGADGTPLVEDIAIGTDIYQGPFADRGPDIVLDGAPGTLFANASWAGDALVQTPQRPDFINGQPRLIGYHHREGLFMITGHSVLREGGLQACVEDIAPTILRALDAPIPRDVDGSPIEGAFQTLTSPRWSDYETRPSSDVDPLTPDDEAAIARQLEDLGYL